MEPVRKIMTRDLTVGPLHLAQGQYVWLICTPGSLEATIEARNQLVRVPVSSLGDVPVPVPLQVLIQLDSCFAAGDETGLEAEDTDDVNIFSVLECRHGNLFLKDTVTGIGWYSRLIFMGRHARAKAAFLELWQRHHRLSNDHVHLMGIGK